MFIFVLAAALQAASPAPEGSPEDKAASLAAMDFTFACMLPLAAYETAAEYAHAADQLGSGLPPPAPAWAAAVRVDGEQGRGCRVRYAGPKAETVWGLDRKFLRALPTAAADAGNGCTFTTDTATRLAGVCASTGDDPAHRTRRADVLLERSGETVTISLTNPRA